MVLRIRWLRKAGFLGFALRLLAACFIAAILVSMPALYLRGLLQSHQRVEQQQLPDYDRLVFENFDNNTGVDYDIVPNIIHLIRFNQTEFSFVDYICFQAAFRNHRPDYFYIHTDAPDGQFEGKYWKLIQKDKELYSRIFILHLDVPSEIFGRPLFVEEWGFWHGSDIARLRILMKHGGIYLDNDVFVIQSLNKYRKFEATVNWDEGLLLGNQIIIANRNARILPLWFDTYKHYRSELWYFNGGELPTKQILFHHPELIHRVQKKFGADTALSLKLYMEEGFDWRKLEAIHLLFHHRDYMDKYYNQTPILDERTVQTYKYPFGEMARELIDLSGMKHRLLNG